MADKGYDGHVFESDLTTLGIDPIRPTRKNESPRPGQQFLKPLRQILTGHDSYAVDLGLLNAQPGHLAIFLALTAMGATS